MTLITGGEGGGGGEWRRPRRCNGEGRVWGGRRSIFIWGRTGSQREWRWIRPFIPALHSWLSGQQSSLILSAVGLHILGSLGPQIWFLKSYRDIFGSGLSCHPHFHIAFPPASGRPVGRTRRPSKPRKSGRNPSCWCGGLLPTTGEVSHILIECLGFVFGSVFFLL